MQGGGYEQADEICIQRGYNRHCRRRGVLFYPFWHLQLVCSPGQADDYAPGCRFSDCMDNFIPFDDNRLLQSFDRGRRRKAAQSQPAVFGAVAVAGRLDLFFLYAGVYRAGFCGDYPSGFDCLQNDTEL